MLNYIEQPYFEANYELIRRAEKSLNGYMNYVRKQIGGKSAREDSAEYTIEPSTEDNSLPNNLTL